MNPTGEPLRTLIHQRDFRSRGFRRADGFWDIEIDLLDHRSYDSRSVEKGVIPAGEAVHDIRICLTVDNDLTVQAVVASMPSVPYHTCPGALNRLHRLAGGSLRRGWRRHVDSHIGDVRGCTHIREMLQIAATVAFQTTPVWWAQQDGDVLRSTDGQPPPHLGTCTTWDFNGPVVARIYPEFKGWTPPPTT